MKKIHVNVGTHRHPRRRQAIPNISFHHLNLIVVEGTFSICKLAPDAPIPPWATASHFLSITRTAEELSVVIPQDRVPVSGQHRPSQWLPSQRFA